jgi:hypothetical protein
MCLFHKQSIEREEVIDYLRHLSAKEYKDLNQIVEIYRTADEEVAVVEAGSKKALREQQKENEELAGALDGLLEAQK